MTFAILLLAVGLVAAEPGADNAVFNQLARPGVSIGGDVPVALPEPTMPDGLDAKAQEAIVKRVAGTAYPLPRFLKNSAVAPHVVKMRDLRDGGGRGRGVDAWFVGYGTIDQLVDKQFRDRMFGLEDDEDVDHQGNTLDAAQLKERGIPWEDSRADVESYAHGSLSLWKRVKVETTVHTYFTRSDDSVIVAAMVDPRFDMDREFPNRWFPLTRTPTGKVTEGSPQPYPGMGTYFKATRLVEPKGALFFEWHIVFAEPRGWFEGANLLGSKVPIIVQSRVRGVRRELAVDQAAPAKR